jgi:hypothetical protein
MIKRLTFRPVGKASFFGDSGTELAEFLQGQYGEIPVTLSIDDIPQLEDWYVSKGEDLPVKGPLGLLIHQIKTFKRVQVGYFDVV